jgi:MoCo/4Fe-4S cofactor protein with predicted Tat translocation signal
MKSPELWRSLDQASEAQAFGDYLRKQFPRFADRFDFDRREFLKVMAASMALGGMSACSREPQERILPYVKAPQPAVAGEPRYYATAVTQGGFALGVLVESNMGRPTKIEGNPSHPASLGATDVFAQAAILDLWDPDRSHTLTRDGQPSTWDALLAAMQDARARLAKTQGKGLRVLTETVTSPTLAAQLAALLARYPHAHWHQYEPINRDNVHDGARIAFGEVLDARYRLEKASVVLSLDADFLGAGPAHVRQARDFMRRRASADDPSAGNRLYAIAGSPTVTSAVADHRLPLRPSAIGGAAAAIAAMLGVAAAGSPRAAAAPNEWLAACARDLEQHRGASLVVAGAGQPPYVHALAHAMNDVLGNDGVTVTYSDPVCVDAQHQGESLRSLVRDMNAGEVDTLLVLGGNPVYSAPADIGFGQALDKVALSVRLGPVEDETSLRCRWHVPAAHCLEAWSDSRAYDGTVTIQQPLLAPLYGGRSMHEMLALFGDGASRSGYDIVRDHWRDKLGADFELGWQTALRDGVVENTALPERQVSPRIHPLPPPAVGAATSMLELIFVPDASAWDGSFANNAWLQELPRPLSKLTWDNAALVSPALARRLSLANGDLIELSHRQRTLQLPVWVMPGHADGAVSVALGYGRTRAGRVGNGCGANAYALRTSDAPWFAGGLEVRDTGKKYPLSTTQHHHAMEGRDLVRATPLAEFRATGAVKPRNTIPIGTLYPPFKYDGYAWGMTINLGTCIGCNACTIACQAENNIPVVGKDEVGRGREMHWIRVDRYYEGTPEAPRTHFQPVPCMQCERAPCELVCPVEASVHDSEGLNVQVYNRCVGTRFCSNNCPYKVRRFNFYQYADEDSESLKGQRNPEVTVRMRGVMEKCSYCIQRIANARIEADKEDRRIRDGEVVTACQAVCPTQAITFGDLNDPASRVNARKASPLNYALLGELNTRPRTTYLGKLTNANPELGEG